eukprot:SAG11_NODE_6208_length_1364_cov_0.815020_1_plen_89_part_10
MELEKQLAVEFAINIIHDGMVVTELSTLPDKAKITVVKGSASPRYNLSVTSGELFEGERECVVSASDIDELAAEVQEALGLLCDIEILH